MAGFNEADLFLFVPSELPYPALRVKDFYLKQPLGWIIHAKTVYKLC
jgi:hypothetical protein